MYRVNGTAIVDYGNITVPYYVFGVVEQNDIVHRQLAALFRINFHNFTIHQQRQTMINNNYSHYQQCLENECTELHYPEQASLVKEQ